MAFRIASTYWPSKPSCFLICFKIVYQRLVFREIRCSRSFSLMASAASIRSTLPALEVIG
jgi:hypothetical protein